MEGIRFLVRRSAAAPWAQPLRSASPGAGLRWETVSVQYKNLAHRSLFAAHLHFHLEAADGTRYGPVHGFGNGGSDLVHGAAIPTGARVIGELVFRVPAQAGNLALIIDPAPRRMISVALGAG